MALKHRWDVSLPILTTLSDICHSEPEKSVEPVELTWNFQSSHSCEKWAPIDAVICLFVIDKKVVCIDLKLQCFSRKYFHLS